jgi:hypothetical protein
MVLLDNWLVIPLVLLLNTIGLKRRTQVILCLVVGIVLAVVAAVIDIESPWPVIAVTTFNNGVVLVLLAVVVDFLRRRLKWVLIATVVVVVMLLVWTSDGRTLLALTTIGLFAVLERWRLLPPFRLRDSQATVANRSEPTASGDKST